MNPYVEQQERRLHVAMLVRAVTHHGLGGMELHAEALRRGLVTRRHRVTTITTALPEGPSISEDHWGKTFHVDSGKPAKYTRDWTRASVETLLNIHANDPIDVIASHGKAVYPYLEVRKQLPAQQHIPVVIISHGTIIDDVRSHVRQLHHRYPQTTARWLARDIRFWRDDRRWLHLANHITVLDNTAAEILCRWFPIERSRITVIPNGVDVEAITAAAGQRNNVRKHLGIDERTIAVLVLARLDPTKGHQHLVKALVSPLLRDFRRAIKLILVGDGPARSELEEQIARLGLQTQVVFCGSVPHQEVPNLLSAADIVVHPSIVEGMPLSLLEAQAASRPVVASRVGAIPDIVEDGVSGVLVPPGESEALAQALVTLLSDPAIARQYAECGRQRVFAQYDQHRMVNRYAEVLERTSMESV